MERKTKIQIVRHVPTDLGYTHYVETVITCQNCKWFNVETSQCEECHCERTPHDYCSMAERNDDK